MRRTILALVISALIPAGASAIDNALEIQDLLGRFSDKILLCLNGHSHVDAYHQLKNVGYLQSMGHELKALQQPYGNMQVVIWDRQANKVSAASEPRGEGSSLVQ